MRVVIQRVNHAYIDLNGSRHSEIKKGLCVFFGVETAADSNDLDWLVRKIINLRIFNDREDKMNLSLQDINGELLVVSQFTLHASTKKGNRPSFILSEKPERAELLYNAFINRIREQLGNRIKTGVFGGDMKVGLENDGPVTILIDTQQKW